MAIDLLRREADRERRAAAQLPVGRWAVPRQALVDMLCRRAVPVVVVAAPAGYGKTTLLAQWVERDPRRSIRLALTPEDDDPDAVDAYLASALDEADRLVVVDDVHVLRAPDALDSLQRALERVAPGSTVAVAGRVAPPLSLGRLRVEGRLLELGADDLALDVREARALLRHESVLQAPHELDELLRRTEGWPAAVYLAALVLRGGEPLTVLAGDDRFVADFLESELLTALSPAQRRFAAESSVLEELSAPACDALLRRRGSDLLLAGLERAGLLVPLDHRGCRYRYRRLVHELLRAKLERAAPERTRALHAAASAWSAEQGSAEEALRHAAAAGEPTRVAALAERFLVPECARGRYDRLERRLEQLRDDPAVGRRTGLCLAGAWLHALRGRPAESRRWADAAARSLGTDDPRLRLLRALRCRDGAEQMREDAEAAEAALPPGDPWRPAAQLAASVAAYLAGDALRADRELVDAVEAAAAVDAAAVRVAGLCIRSLLAAERDAAAEADALVARARTAAEAAASEPSAIEALLHAVSAHAAIRLGDGESAAAAAARAGELQPFLTDALPWLSALTQLELVRVRLALGDADGARVLLRRVEDVLRVQPRLGAVAQRAAELELRVHALAGPEARWASSLTPAEARLLPLLATHLSFLEIGERLHVSRNTVKTQAVSIYRKLGASGRSDAVARALDLGLVAAHGALVRQCGSFSEYARPSSSKRMRA